MKTQCTEFFKDLQDRIVLNLEELDGNRFHEDLWVREAGGGGRTRILSEGGLFEKAGVNFSEVFGEFPEEFAKTMPGEGNHFFATGVSLVLHPRNPFIPTVHANFRFLTKGGYGWFGGGRGGGPPVAPVATVDRIDFSNDSTTASPRSPLSSSRYGLGATGNSNYGWFGGGFLSAAATATVDRIDFSNDSATISVRSPLSLARYYLAATGNSNYGWFGAGTPGPITTADRINFSNDLTTTSIRGILGSKTFFYGATSNITR